VSALSERLLIAAIAWGALAFGGVYAWAYWPLAWACALLGMNAMAFTRAWQDQRVRGLAVALGVVALAIAIQLVALPYWVLLWLSPAFDRFFREYQLVYHPASLHALSIDPTSTFVALVLFISFALLLIGLVCLMRRMDLEWLVTGVMGIGLALSVVGIVHKAFLNPELVYGFWKPQQSGNIFGPFINRNHFAGWMLMALPVVVGYGWTVLARATKPQAAGWAAWLRWMTTIDASRFVRVAFCALLMGIALVLTGSRSGIASLVVAILVFGYFAMRQARERRVRMLVATYLAALLLGAVIWASIDTATGRFLLMRAESPVPLKAWQDTLDIVSDFTWFGTGIGTYAQAMLVYQTSGRPVMYAQAHNDYLQLLAEGGLLVAVPAAILVVVVVEGVRRRLTTPGEEPLIYWLRIGAVAGLAAIATQSVVDFSLQMPGNRVLFVLLLAIALHRPRVDSRGLTGESRDRAAYSHAHRV
jgi:O-antigen ligase